MGRYIRIARSTNGENSVTSARIYLAGPDVFLTEAVALAQAKRDLCARYGFIGVSPIDNEIDKSNISVQETAHRISAANETVIHQCNLVIANITPFRGPSADVGTAYEMGYARALGLPVLAYTNVDGDLLARTRQALGNDIAQRAPGHFEDSFRMVIENFHQVDNLMLTGAVQASGVPVVVTPVEMELRFTSLVGFEECLKQALRLIHPSTYSRPRALEGA